VKAASGSPKRLIKTSVVDFIQARDKGVPSLRTNRGQLGFLEDLGSPFRYLDKAVIGETAEFE
jgi:hypothetical protein